MKTKFKLTKHHLQGAVAMLLVFVVAISALAVTPGLNLFGTVFKGYEDAEELPVTIEPGEIEARADYAGETFTLTGLPEGEAKNIKPEHVFLGGYLGNLAVTGLEVQEDTLLVTIGAGESANDADSVDWEDYEGGDGIIAVSPEAFKSKSYYYQGIVTVIYPELTIDIEEVAQDNDLSVNQPITLTLKNDNFAGTLTAADIEITGGFDSAKAENLKQDGNSLSFTLSGKADGGFGQAYFALSGDTLEKGLPLQVSAGIGRVPGPVQASCLYINENEQILKIFMDYDSYTEDVNLAMLHFGGVMNDFDVTGFELIDHKMIALTLKGSIKEAKTGTVRFDSAAVASGMSGRTCEIEVDAPRQAQEKPETPEPEDNNMPLIAAPSGINAQSLVMLGSSGNGIMQIDLVDDAIGMLPIPGIGKSFAGYIWTMSGGRAATHGWAVEMGLAKQNTFDLLAETLAALADISEKQDKNHRELMARMDKVEFKLDQTKIAKDYDYVSSYYDTYLKRMASADAGDTHIYDSWAEDYLIYKSDGNNENARKYVEHLGTIIRELNVYDTNALKPYADSIFLSYEQMLKGKVPFENNVCTGMIDYLNTWDMEIAQYLLLANEMVEYTKEEAEQYKEKAEQYKEEPEKYEKEIEQYESFTKYYVNAKSAVEDTAKKYHDEGKETGAFDKIVEHIAKQPYTQSYNNLTADWGKPNKILYIVTNDGNKYLLADNANSKYCYNTDTFSKNKGKYKQGGRSGQGYAYDEKGNDYIIKPKDTLTVDSASVSFSVTRADFNKVIEIKGKPKTFWKYLNNALWNKASLNTIFKNYLFTMEMQEDKSWKRKDLWFLESGITPDYLYWGNCEHFNLFTAVTERAGFFYLNGNGFKETRSGASDDMQDLENGYKSSDVIAILMCVD